MSKGLKIKIPQNTAASWVGASTLRPVKSESNTTHSINAARTMEGVKPTKVQYSPITATVQIARVRRLA